MDYFLDTVETIPNGLGFSYYDSTHLTWLCVGLLTCILATYIYKKSNTTSRKRIRIVWAMLLLLNETFKVVCLAIGGNYMLKYLPFHLCSINIILIAVHAVRPGKVLDSFLYAICIPAAISALLFPTWTELPLMNFMHIHSFTVHIMLFGYPLMLTIAGDINPTFSDMKKSVILLLCMAIPIGVFNVLFDTNFLFLRYLESTNPLSFFETIFGNHLIGFIFLIPIIYIIMYIPICIKNRISKK